MKKAFSLLWMMALLVALLGATAYAAGTPTMELGGCEAAPGDEITVPLCLVNNPGIIAVELTVNYDAALEWIDVQEGDYGGSLGDYELGVGQTVAWFARDERENVVQDGVLVTLRFRVKENAQRAQVSVTFNEDDVFNEAMDNVPFVVKPATVTIQAPAVRGDLNGDGKADDQDISLLIRFLVSRGKDVSLPTSGDLNGDGLVNGADLVKLAQIVG